VAWGLKPCTACCMLLVAWLLSGRIEVCGVRKRFRAYYSYISRAVTCRTLHFPTQFILCVLYICVLLTRYCSVDKIEKSEMGGACSAYGGRGEAYTGFWWGNEKRLG
jgi:hypothetical protein